MGDELESLRSDASALKEFDNLVVRQDQELTDSCTCITYPLSLYEASHISKACQVSLLRLQNFLEIKRGRRLTVLLQDCFKNLAVVVSDMTKTFKNNKNNNLKVFPQAIDICLLSEVRCMIDVPEVLLAEAFVDALTLRLPQLLLAWNSQVTRQLADLVRAQLGGIDNDVDPLKLAALVFRCSNCRSHVTYPSALAHPCLRAKTLDKPWVQLPMETTALGRRMSLVEVYENAAIEAFEMYPWNCTVLEAGGCFKRIHNLFQVLGRDPNSTTVDDMESCPIRVTCKSCSGSRNRMILTYRTAVCIFINLLVGPCSLLSICSSFTWYETTAIARPMPCGVLLYDLQVVRMDLLEFVCSYTRYPFMQCIAGFWCKTSSKKPCLVIVHIICESLLSIP